MNCPTCHRPMPEPTGPHVVDGVTVEPIVAPFAPGIEFWRAKGRPELPLATTPAQAAQLAQLQRHPVTIGGIEARPFVRNPGDPDEVRFWRAIDARGRHHDAPTPEAAAQAAGARTE